MRLNPEEHDLLIRMLARLSDEDLALLLPEVSDNPRILDTAQELFDWAGDAWEDETGEVHPEHEPSDEFVASEFEELEAFRELVRALDGSFTVVHVGTLTEN